MAFYLGINLLVEGSKTNKLYTLVNSSDCTTLYPSVKLLTFRRPAAAFLGTIFDEEGKKWGGYLSVNSPDLFFELFFRYLLRARVSVRVRVDVSVNVNVNVKE